MHNFHFSSLCLPQTTHTKPDLCWGVQHTTIKSPNKFFFLFHFCIIIIFTASVWWYSPVFVHWRTGVGWDRTWKWEGDWMSNFNPFGLLFFPAVHFISNLISCTYTDTGILPTGTETHFSVAKTTPRPGQSSCHSYGLLSVTKLVAGSQPNQAARQPEMLFD